MWIVGEFIHLFRSAPRWRALVIAASLFTLAAVYNAIFSASPRGPSEPAPTLATTPTSPVLKASDPSIESRLSDYEAHYSEAAKQADPVNRCDQIAASYAALQERDRAWGSNPSYSPGARIAALAAGRRCREDIAASDSHFDAVERAVSAADQEMSEKNLMAVKTALSALDAFDRARVKFKDEGNVLASTARLEEADAASRRRVSDFVRTASLLRSQPSVSTLQDNADALRAMTPFDRERLTPSQKPLLAEAEHAAEMVGESRARFSQLSKDFADSRQNQTNEAVQRLLASAARITSFDEELARPEELATLANARAIASPAAWHLLGERMAVLQRDPSPDNYSAIADLYRLIAGNKSLPANDEQRRLLHDAESANTFLLSSDTRLKNFDAVASTWSSDSPLSSSELAAFDAITAFDRRRFDPSQQASWDSLSRAEIILRPPASGLTAELRDRIAIYVFTSGASPKDRQLANSLKQALRQAGYRVAAGRQDAALLTEVSIRAVDDPQLDTNEGPVATYVAGAHVDFVARWAANDAVLLSGTADASGSGGPSDAGTSALLNAINIIVERFRQVTRK